MHEIAFAFLQSVLCVTQLVKFWLGLGRLSTPSLHLYGTRQKRPRWPNAGCTRCVRHCTYAGPPRRTAGRLALALPGRPACRPAQVHSRSSQVQGGNPTKAGALTLCAPGRCPVRQSPRGPVFRDTSLSPRDVQYRAPRLAGKAPDSLRQAAFEPDEQAAASRKPIACAAL
jgi:hypothetical protein